MGESGGGGAQTGELPPLCATIAPFEPCGRLCPVAFEPRAAACLLAADAHVRLCGAARSGGPLCAAAHPSIKRIDYGTEQEASQRQ